MYKAASLLLVLSLPLAAQTPPAAQPADPASELYAGYCAACHGDAMEGGRGPSLVSNQWVYGGDEAAVVTSIRDGRSGGDMPAFSGVLNGPQIRTLAVFIRDRASRVSRQQTQKPVTVPVNGVVKTELESFKIETVAEGLVTPWGLDFFPDGRILVSERNGQLRIVDNGKLLPPSRAFQPPGSGKTAATSTSPSIRTTQRTDGFIWATPRPVPTTPP